MAEARLRTSWTQTASLIRSIGNSFAGKEPRLECYIPARFRPQLARPQVEEYTPEARRAIVTAHINAIHGRK